MNFFNKWILIWLIIILSLKKIGEYYSNYSEVDINEIDNAILTVLALVSENNHSDFKNELEKLAKDEKNIKIREFAMKILAEYY